MSFGASGAPHAAIPRISDATKAERSGFGSLEFCGGERLALAPSRRKRRAIFATHDRHIQNADVAPSGFQFAVLSQRCIHVARRDTARNHAPERIGTRGSGAPGRSRIGADQNHCGGHRPADGVFERAE